MTKTTSLQIYDAVLRATCGGLAPLENLETSVTYLYYCYLNWGLTKLLSCSCWGYVTPSPVLGRLTPVLRICLTPISLWPLRAGLLRLIFLSGIMNGHRSDLSVKVLLKKEGSIKSHSNLHIRIWPDFWPYNNFWVGLNLNYAACCVWGVMRDE